MIIIDQMIGTFVKTPLHYICFRCYKKGTKSERTSDTADLLRHNFDMIKTSLVYASAIAAAQLIHAVENPNQASILKVK